MNFKKVFFIAAFLASFSSLACSQFEAQFTGTVKDLRLDSGVCTFKISFSSYNQSIVCPLSYGVATSNEYSLNCPKGEMKNGDYISGYIVETQGQVLLDL